MTVRGFARRECWTIRLHVPRDSDFMQSIASPRHDLKRADAAAIPATHDRQRASCSACRRSERQVKIRLPEGNGDGPAATIAARGPTFFVGKLAGRVSSSCGGHLRAMASKLAIGRARNDIAASGMAEIFPPFAMRSLKLTSPDEDERECYTLRPQSGDQNGKCRAREKTTTVSRTGRTM